MIISDPKKNNLDNSLSGLKHHEANYFSNTLEIAKKFNIKHELLDAVEIRKRFPQFRVSDNETGYFEYEAGFLRPEDCIRAQLSLAEKRGAHIHLNEKVEHFTERENEVIVRTNCGEYYAEQLVITAGPWLHTFLDSDLQSFFEVRRQVLYWFGVDNSFDQFMPGRFPVFIWETLNNTSVYGFPAIDGANGGIKIAPGAHGPIVTTDTVNREVGLDEIKSMYEHSIAPLPSLL